MQEFLLGFWGSDKRKMLYRLAACPEARASFANPVTSAGFLGFLGGLGTKEYRNPKKV
jgi:hypothetical protein